MTIGSSALSVYHSFNEFKHHHVYIQICFSFNGHLLAVSSVQVRVQHSKKRLLRHNTVTCSSAAALIIFDVVDIKSISFRLRNVKGDGAWDLNLSRDV
jgi:hypothetical protein